MATAALCALPNGDGQKKRTASDKTRTPFNIPFLWGLARPFVNRGNAGGPALASTLAAWQPDMPVPGSYASDMHLRSTAEQLFHGGAEGGAAGTELLLQEDLDWTLGRQLLGMEVLSTR